MIMTKTQENITHKGAKRSSTFSAGNHKATRQRSTALERSLTLLEGLNQAYISPIAWVVENLFYPFQTNGIFHKLQAIKSDLFIVYIGVTFYNLKKK